MTLSNIPLLTDIIETGDEKKAGLHRSVINAESISTALSNDNDELNEKIEQAIDAVLPTIKRQLHQQLLSRLNQKTK